MPASATAREAGFTLIETLVTISVLSLMSLLAFATLRIGTSLWTRGEQNAGAVADVSAIQELLRETIERAYPAVILLPGRGYIVAFHGTRNELEFSSSLPPEVAIGGRRRIRIARNGEGDRGRLVLTSRLERNLADMAALPQPEQRIDLLADIRSIDFAYFGLAEDSELPEWRTDWVDQKQLPRLVRVDVAFADRARHWPPLSVATRIDVDSNCVLDPLTKLCRGR